MYISYVTVNYVSIVLLVIFKDVKLLIKDNEERPFEFSKIYVQEIFDALLIVNYVSTENSHQTDINPRYGKFRDKHFLYKVRQSSSSKEWNMMLIHSSHLHERKEKESNARHHIIADQSHLNKKLDNFSTNRPHLYQVVTRKFSELYHCPRLLIDNPRLVNFVFHL